MNTKINNPHPLSLSQREMEVKINEAFYHLFSLWEKRTGDEGFVNLFIRSFKWRSWI
jgi:hypothetical protein